MQEVRDTLPNRACGWRKGIPVEERRRLMHSDTPGRDSRSPSPIAATLSRLGASLIDTLYPPRCLACSEPTDAPHGLCSVCWRNTDFITGPACRICGLPLLGEAGPDDICEECQRHPPAWNRGVPPFFIVVLVVKWCSASSTAIAWTSPAPLPAGWLSPGGRCSGG